MIFTSIAIIQGRSEHDAVRILHKCRRLSTSELTAFGPSAGALRQEGGQLIEHGQNHV
jgi:hypothetical protein